MTTATRNFEQGALHGATRTEPGPIIVASDGGAPAATALAVAKRLRDLTGARIQVVSVVEPLAAVVPAPLLLAAPVPDSRVQQRHDLVREQVDRIVGTTPHVEIGIAVGWPPEVLAETVRDSDASFFVAGLVHHGRIERLARPETPLAVLRGARAPVLAMPWGMMREPRCIVVGVDLADSSVVAARRAAPLLHRVDKAYLLHVQEPVAPLAEIPYVPPDDEHAIQEAMARVRAALGLPRDATVESRVLVGHPAFELADFAEYVRADLIVLGHRHRGLWGRMLHSSVAERTYRAASCGVLIVPDDAPPAAGGSADADGIVTTRFARDSWAAELRSFSQRNEGRRVNLEVLTRDFGAQAASVNFLLGGVDFDAVRDRVEIMLSEGTDSSRHLGHAIERATTIELSHLEGRGDRALRIVHEGGATLLTFVR